MITHIPSDSVFEADFGWLQTRHLFSFGHYFDPANIQHGQLRVFNDDWIAARQGFGKHPHHDAEIVTIVLAGAVTHGDSMGNSGQVRAGEVQRMSAGSGVIHSEMNDGDEPLHLYQLWFLPRQASQPKGYEQKSFAELRAPNGLTRVVSGAGESGALAIGADAEVSLGQLESSQEIKYSLASDRAVLIYLTSGELEIGEYRLQPGDQLRIADESGELAIRAAETAEFVLIDTAK